MSTEQARVEKLLNMLSSSFEGERANAAAILAEMAAVNKHTVSSYVKLMLIPSITKTPKSDYKSWMTPSERKAVELLETLEELLESEDIYKLTPWEANFCHDIIHRRPVRLSEKQTAIILRVIRKLEP